MGASLGGGGSRRGQRRSHRPMADINVTPMVDVMLVLLVIFMVTAPLLSTGVPLELPKTSAGELKGDDKPISVSIKADGTVWLQDTQVEVADLAARLKAITAEKPDTTIFVRGDGGVNYGRIAEVLSTLSAAGFGKLSLVTQPGSGSGSGSGDQARKGRR